MFSSVWASCMCIVSVNCIFGIRNHDEHQDAEARRLARHHWTWSTLGFSFVIFHMFALFPDHWVCGHFLEESARHGGHHWIPMFCLVVVWIAQAFQDMQVRMGLLWKPKGLLWKLPWHGS